MARGTPLKYLPLALVWRKDQGDFSSRKRMPTTGIFTIDGTWKVIIWILGAVGRVSTSIHIMPTEDERRLTQ